MASGSGCSAIPASTTASGWRGAVTAGELRVERVFPGSFLPGPVLRGTIRGEIAAGDELVLERADGTRATGRRATTLDFNRPSDAREDHSLASPSKATWAAIAEVGDLIRTVEPDP
jgi:hypothetical protein